MRSSHSTGTGFRSLRSLRFGVALVAAATAVMGAASAGTASAVPTSHANAGRNHGHYGIGFRTNAAKETPNTSSGVLNWQGGPVQHASSVYLDFWGAQWNSDSNGVESYYQNLFNGLGTASDSWSRVASQYTDGSGLGPSFSGPELHGSWVDSASSAPSNASASQISAEANRAASHFGVAGSNVQIVVLSPSGTHPDGFPNTGFCAWHDYNGNVPYTNMPYVLDAGASCGADSVQNQLDGFSIVGGHEYSETLTDPEPASGYIASDGEENADLCAWQGLGAISLPTGTFAMQPTWSNRVNGCSMS